MQHINLITRRGFLDRSMKIGLGVTLSTMVDVPFVLKRALAEGNIGLNGKKLLFIWLRFGNDSLNSVIPVEDPGYLTMRPVATGGSPANIGIPKDPGTTYTDRGACDFPVAGTGPTFGYANAIRLGNGYAGLHPSLKFLAPVYNAGDLSIIHRVGYANQSRSHFDSQIYWENGNPRNNVSKDGILYRTIYEAIQASPTVASRALTGVSIQTTLPLLLRGKDAAMTNLSDVTRYDLLNVPNSLNTNLVTKADMALTGANAYPFPEKAQRELLQGQYQNLMNTLPLFKDIAADLATPVLDDEATDGDYPYNLFPTSNNTNGGYVRGGGAPPEAAKYVVPTDSYSFFTKLKAAALVLNKTEATIAGTEYGGFDTHSAQGGVTGAHSDLNRRLGWSLYALRKYFMAHSDQVTWDNLVVVTLSEFGRTTRVNSDFGTDHGEAGVMWVAGGAVKGFVPGAGANPPVRSGVIGCHGTAEPTRDPIPWIPGTGSSSSMLAVEGSYLKRTADYRSVMGEIIREHLGATQAQLDRIIPGYADEANHHLKNGGTVVPPIERTNYNTQIRGELDVV